MTFFERQAFAYHISGLEVFICWKFKQHRFKIPLTDLFLLVQISFICISVIDRAYEAFKPRCIVDICHAAFHGKRSLADHRCSSITPFVAEQS